MRRIAIINQKGGVGKTTTTANLGAALAIQGRRVVLVDMDAQANLSLALGVEARSGTPTTYSVLGGTQSIDACLRATKVPNLRLLPSNIDLSGAELELASAMGREYLLRDALKEWDDAHKKKHKKSAADYVLFDCPPSLGLLSINALAAAGEVLITLQTEFLALQGMSKLVEIVALLKKRLNPDLVVVGIVPTLYDIRLKLAREVLGEIRRYFKDQVMPHPIRANVKLAEAPSFAQTIFEYAPDSNGAVDYMHLAQELIARESSDADLVGLTAFDATARLPSNEPAPTTRRMPPPRRKKEVEPVIAPSPSTKLHVPVPAIAVQPPSPSVVAASNAAANKESKAKPSVQPKQVEALPAVSQPTKPTISAKSTESKKEPTPTQSSPSKKEPVSAKGAESTSVLVPAKRSPAARPAAPAKDAPAKPATPNSAQPKAAARDEAETKNAVANGVHGKPPTTNGAHDKSVRSEPAPTRTQSKTLKPVPRTARVDDIPPLPPDAFEILSTPIDP